MLKVVGNRILIKPDEVEMERDIGGGKKIVLVKDEKLYRGAQDVGVVVQIGPAAWFDFSPEHRQWCKVGDKVVYARHAGKQLIDPDTSEQFVLINDNDVQCLIVLNNKKGKK